MSGLESTTDHMQQVHLRRDCPAIFVIGLMRHHSSLGGDTQSPCARQLRFGDAQYRVLRRLASLAAKNRSAESSMKIRLGLGGQLRSAVHGSLGSDLAALSALETSTRAGSRSVSASVRDI